MLTFEGSDSFRIRLILSTISGMPVKITNIRSDDDEPGVSDYEASFLRLLNHLTNGTKIVLNETGTTLRYVPGLLLGGTLEHDCGTEKPISYFLEALLSIAPFCKKPIEATLKGITNDCTCATVDAIKLSSLPVLKKFRINEEGLDIKIVSRGMAPGGGGEVIFRCPIINYIRPVKLIDEGKIKRIRGISYSVRVSPTFSNRMVDKAKGVLLQFLPDVYIYTDHYKGKHSGKSPGFGICLVAESTSGVFLVGEAASRPSGSTEGLAVPEDVAEKAANNLLEEIYRGGCVDSRNQGLTCLLMSLSTTDVSKLKIGPLTSQTVSYLQHIWDFLSVEMKLDAEDVKYGPSKTVENNCNLGTHRKSSKTESDFQLEMYKLMVTCVGTGFTNINKAVT